MRYGDAGIRPNGRGADRSWRCACRPAQLSLRADVPAPPLNDPAPEELNAAVRDHFTNTRPDDILDRTLTSPNKSRIAVVYHRPGDLAAEFRLDIYSSDGKLLSKVTPDNLAVHFPDTIVWSPDSANLAFAAMIRGDNGDSPPEPGASPSPTPTPEPVDGDATEPQATPEATPTPAGEPTPTPPTGVLAFRTERDLSLRREWRARPAADAE